MRIWPIIFLGAAVALAGASAAAERFKRVDDAEQFVGLVQGKSLTRFGIRLEVSPDGGISGRAFGRPVTGSWAWSDDGFFCRDLAFGQREIGLNCQAVLVDGRSLRFIADRGQGDAADLVIR